MHTTKYTVVITLIIFVLSSLLLVCTSKNSSHEYSVYSDLEKMSIEQMAKESTFISHRQHFQNSNGQSILILAILSGQTKLVPTLINTSKIDLNIQDNLGNTALMYAAKKSKNYQMIKTMIASKADINIANNNGETAIMFAAQYNTKIDIIQLLIDNGADVAIENNEGLTVWDYFQENPKIGFNQVGSLLALSNEQRLFERLKKATSGNADQVQYANTNGSALYKKGMTSIMFVAKYAQHPERIIKDLSSIADVHAVDENGNNAVYYALNNIHSKKAARKAFNALQNLNITLNFENNEGLTSLLIALKHNYPRSILSALINDAEVINNETNKDTALKYAALYSKHKSIHNKLLRHGFPINRIDKDNNSVVHYLIAGINKSRVDILKTYINHGLDLGYIDIDGHLPLHLITKYASNPKIFDAIIQKNWIQSDQRQQIMLQANSEAQSLLHITARYNPSLRMTKRIVQLIPVTEVYARDVYNKTALNYAIEFNKNPQIIRYIMRFRGNITAEVLGSTDSTILMQAARNSENNKAVSSVIAISRKLIDIQDTKGNTALHYAALNSKDTKAINTLIKAGADVNIKNNLGQTPLMLAVQNTNSPETTVALINAPKINVNLLDNQGIPAIIYAANYSIFVENVYLLNSLDIQIHPERDKFKGKTLNEHLLINEKLHPYFVNNKLASYE